MKCSMCKEEIKGEYYKIEDKIIHADCFRCNYCKKVIEGKYQEKAGEYYHLDCFKEKFGYICDKCGKILDDKWINYKDKKYHEECYEKEFMPVCDVCNGIIREEYICDVWGNKAHKSHDDKKTILCDSCGRIISKKTSKGGYKLADGRISCGICQNTAITTESQTAKLDLEVRKILSEKNIYNIPRQIPIFLVDRNTLKKEIKSVYSDTRGVARTTENVLNKKVIKIESVIFILNSLPEVEFMGVLAHEILHVWAAVNKAKLKGAELEGFCNLGSYLVYNSIKNKFSEILLKRMEMNKDKIYGEGYRKMKEKLDEIGWKKLLDNLIK